jgi:formate dehydrogenase maturation protein FdhE
MHTENLWLLAISKWAEIGASSPELAPALALQQGMLRILIDAAERLEDSGAEPPELPEMTPDRVLSKWARGIPALRNEAIPIPAHLKQLLPALCDTLVNGGAGDGAVHIKDALTRGEIDAGSLLSVSLARNQKAIRTSSLHHGFAPDLVWLIGELGSAPLAHFCQARLLNPPSLQKLVREWDRGYCPCCGSWPALIEVLNGPGRRSTAREGGARFLLCSFCAASWELKTHRCIYCGNADERFVALAPDMARQDRRIELCGGCGNYTKVIEVNALTPFPLIAIEDLATVDLDQAAMGHEYGRPTLFDLDTIDPPRDCS